jgi:hypothetical protein
VFPPIDLDRDSVVYECFALPHLTEPSGQVTSRALVLLCYPPSLISAVRQKSTTRVLGFDLPCFRQVLISKHIKTKLPQRLNLTSRSVRGLAKRQGNIAQTISDQGGSFGNLIAWDHLTGEQDCKRATCSCSALEHADFLICDGPLFIFLFMFQQRGFGLRRRVNLWAITP